MHLPVCVGECDPGECDPARAAERHQASLWQSAMKGWPARRNGTPTPREHPAPGPPYWPATAWKALPPFMCHRASRVLTVNGVPVTGLPRGVVFDPITDERT